jgi:AAA15 family ATPase/GTPase
MLLQFQVGNFRSFGEETLLNMVPAKSRIHPKHVLKADDKGRVKALPLAILYGANASGKSNLVNAIGFARNLVVSGTRAGELIGTTPFRLSAEWSDKPSRFEFVLKHEDVLYTYGFLVTRQVVVEEWLFATYRTREVRLFERVTNEGKTSIETGEKLSASEEERQRLRFVAEGTRPNQLFLTEANERNVELLKPLMQWFTNRLVVLSPNALYRRLTLRAHRDAQFVSFLSEFLSAADTGVQGLRVKTKDVDLASMSEDLRKSLTEGLDRDPEHSFPVEYAKHFPAFQQGDDKTVQYLAMVAKHNRSDGQSVDFEIEDESDGTIRMMNLAPALFDLQSSEMVYVVDELDRSMHPLLSRMFVEAFLKGVEEGKCRGQMIVTSHETSLLDLDLLRRDEIWFVEKDKGGASHLTSLAEFKSQVRADLRIAKGYLNGRFGAIPFVGDIRSLLRK